MPGHDSDSDFPPNANAANHHGSSGREIYYSAALALVVAVAALAVGLTTSGTLAVVAYIVLAAAVVYLLHIVVAVLGFHRLNRLVDRLFATGHEGDQQVQIRVPVAPGSEPAIRDLLFDELNRRLGKDGACDEMRGGGRQFSYVVYGRDKDRLIEACRSATAGFKLPSGTHLWIPNGRRHGERLEL